MSQTRESRLYLNFFRQHGLLILAPAILCSTAIITYQLSRPPLYQNNVLLEMLHNDQNGSERIALTDEAVTLLRSEQIQNQLATTGIKTTIFKPGPLAISLTVEGTDPQRLEQALIADRDYATTKYPLQQVGEIVSHTEASRWWLYGGAGFAAGLLLGIAISLIKYYFLNY